MSHNVTTRTRALLMPLQNNKPRVLQFTLSRSSPFHRFSPRKSRTQPRVIAAKIVYLIHAVSHSANFEIPFARIDFAFLRRIEENSYRERLNRFMHRFVSLFRRKFQEETLLYNDSLSRYRVIYANGLIRNGEMIVEKWINSR